MPLVSVVLPTFNRTTYLGRAIQSVVNQSYRDWEMLIADDGSGEETAAFLRGLSDPRVRMMWLEHSGNPAHVRNVALREAKTRYVAFLDSDDVWHPEKLAKQLRALAEHPSARWSYTLEDRIDAGDRALPTENAANRRQRGGWIFAELLRLEIAISMPALVVERELLASIGGFDERQRFAEWHDLALRLASSAEAVLVPEILCSIRAHEQHFSANRSAALADWARLYAKMLRVAPSDELRNHCARMRTKTLFELAAREWRQARYGRAVAALANAVARFW